MATPSKKPSARKTLSIEEEIEALLLKRGYQPSEDGERHAVFHMPKRQIKLPRPPSKAKVALGQAMAAKRRSSLGESSVHAGNEGVKE